ncbi:MAG: hypothetical protein ACFFC0_07995, partial [Promethearchaeota archaeon]
VDVNSKGAEANTGGLGSDSEAYAEVKIGDAQLKALTQSEIRGNAKLNADRIELDALVNKLRVKASTDAYAGAAGAAVEAESDVKAYEVTEVLLRGGATIRASEEIEIDARHENLNTESRANADFDGVGGDTDATARNYLITTARIVADSGANILTHHLSLSTITDGPQMITYANTSGGLFGFIDIGDETEETKREPERLIHFDANVTILGPKAELEIDALGNLVKAEDISCVILADEIIVNDIGGSTSAGTVTFYINNTPWSTNQDLVKGTIQGGPYFEYDTAFESVTIINESAKNLIINNIDPRTDTPPIIQAGAPGVDTQGLHYDPASPQPYSRTLIVIENRSGSDIILREPAALDDKILIDNPIGTTKLLNTGGNIHSVGPRAVLKTNIITLETQQGSLGSSAEPIQVVLVQSDGPVDFDFGRMESGGSILISATGTDGVHLNLQGVLEQEASELTVFAPFIESDGIINFTIQAGIKEMQGQMPVHSVYRFGNLTGMGELGLQAGGNIIITAEEADIVAVTDILTTGMIDVTASGFIELEELTGDLRVGRISSTSGNVALTAQDGIVDALNDEDSDVDAAGIVLAAREGSIGIVGNALEIDSSRPTSGILIAQAQQGIHIIEVEGRLNVGSVKTSRGDLSLLVQNTGFPGEDLTINDVIEAANGNVTLIAGDDISTVRSSEIRAFHGKVFIRADQDGTESDPEGGIINLEGQIYATGVEILGGIDDDLINVGRIWRLIGGPVI